MKKELLSPAGDMESLKAAIHGGCDAVYIGGKRFGARKFATNFSDEELIEAVSYCHLYGVRLYVTVNTMIYEDEMKSALEYVGFLYKSHVDAVIVQDIGLITEIRKWIPDMEVHVSTQAHNYSEDSFRLFEEIGVKRVVLARELTLSEIENISTSLEKEVFIHGAICISYSGQCLFSSLVMGRSGNRGECAGMCRLPYSLECEGKEVPTDGNYLLSPKELCTISQFQELMESDITSFKIEGRMKSPAYVYLVTNIYRTLMDQFERGKKLEISQEKFEELQVLYNRQFTSGHLFSQHDFDLMNIQSPNHLGVSLGRVLSVDKKRIKIQLSRFLHQGDGIRFVQNGKGMIVNFLYNQEGLLIREAHAKSVVFVDNKVDLKEVSEVLKTTDSRLVERLSHYPLKKIPISMKFVGKVGSPLSLEVSDKEHVLSLEKGEVYKAEKRSTTREEIYDHLQKIGNTPYALEFVDIDLEEGCFIPMSVLNDLRRDVILQLTDLRTYSEPVTIPPFHEEKNELIKAKKVQLCCLVRNEEQLLAALQKKLARIYITDYDLYQKYSSDYDFLYYRFDRIRPRKDSVKNGLATEFCQLYSRQASAVDYYFNIANSSFLQYLADRGVQSVCLSPELSISQIMDIARKNVAIDLEAFVYGRIELMIMKYCPLHMLIHQGDGPCHVCSKSYSLIDRNHEHYPIVSDFGITHLFSSSSERFQQKELQKLLDSGISMIRVEFLDESAQEVKNILENYSRLLQNH